MLVRSLSECAEFIAGDGSLLHELLHPDKICLLYTSPSPRDS